MHGPEFLKGHGTENDFILLPDPQGELSLSDERVRALCDRRRGLGADGILRVVRAGAMPELAVSMPSDVWFMDYRNADGSLAEMCGNGVRVFARYLVDVGLVNPGDGVIGTRAGTRQVHTHTDGRVTVDMGPAMVLGESSAVVGAHRLDGIAIDVGNPHLACVTGVDLDELDLSLPPSYDPSIFPNGVNVELVRPESTSSLRMRVHERGVGETRSCGTGTVAAVVAALRARGEDCGQQTVHVPGGVLEVEVGRSQTWLTGPVVFTARGHLDHTWWQATERDAAIEPENRSLSVGY